MQEMPHLGSFKQFSLATKETKTFHFADVADEFYKAIVFSKYKYVFKVINVSRSMFEGYGEVDTTCRHSSCEMTTF